MIEHHYARYLRDDTPAQLAKLSFLMILVGGLLFQLGGRAPN
jgi:hypothetical protein